MSVAIVSFHFVVMNQEGILLLSYSYFKKQREIRVLDKKYTYMLLFRIAASLLQDGKSF